MKIPLRFIILLILIRLMLEYYNKTINKTKFNYPKLSVIPPIIMNFKMTSIEVDYCDYC
jgi:hypothetical protein